MSFAAKNVYVALPATQRGAPVHLGGDPKGNTFLYTNGNSVIIRDINNPLIAETYNEHQVNTTVARYSPSGYYIASADQSGKVRIWDTTNKEHILKYEYTPLSGAIKDLAWSDDSKRIVVVGDGREKFGSVFLWDSGSSVGEIQGHSKAINSCTFRQVRPYAIVTGGEDFQTSFFTGPPFKYIKGDKDHTRFVNCVRYSPDGSKYLTVGSDAKGFFYDGKTGEKLGELGNAENAHKGSIMSCSWSPDGSQVLTASADKTCKIWDVATNQLVTTFTFGDSVEDQQLGCLWQGKHLLSVALSGHISYLDINNPSVPLRVLKGHNKNITSLAVENNGNEIFSGSYDGRIISWSLGTGGNEDFAGKGHTNQVTQLSVQGDNIVSVGLDDSLRYTSSSSKTYGDEKVSFDAVPNGFAISKSSDLTIVATSKSVEILRGKNKVGSLKADYEPQAAAIHPSESHAAIGGKDGKVYVYTISGNNLSLAKTLDSKGPVTDLAYSPNGKYLASADTQRSVIVWDAASFEQKVSGWVYHTARVNTIAWNTDSRLIASAGLDTNIFVWNIEEPSKRIEIKRAHPASISRVAWVNKDTLISAGDDCCVRSWNVVG